MEMPRNILYYILIVAMLSVFCECDEGEAEQTNYNISCEGNGHIRIRTPAETKYVASKCSNGTKIVNVPNDNKTVIVNHCPLNQNVQISMYNVSKEIVRDSNNIIIKPDITTIVVMCDGTGLTVDTSFNNSAASFKPLIVTDQETLTMKVFDKSESNDQEVKTIKVGVSYRLQIEAADNLNIHVQSCNASSGVNGTEQVQLYQQLKNGTSTKENGVFQGDFVETQLKRASIDMTGFRFVGKDTVLITCTVDVSSPKTATAQPSNTPGTSKVGYRRKRRNTFQKKHTKNLAVSTSLRVESHYASTNGVKGMGGNEGRCMWIASILIVKYSLRWF